MQRASSEASERERGTLSDSGHADPQKSAGGVINRTPRVTDASADDAGVSSERARRSGIPETALAGVHAATSPSCLVDAY